MNMFQYLWADFISQWPRVDKMALSLVVLLFLGIVIFLAFLAKKIDSLFGRAVLA
ncbi:MAG: hypothetical protein HZC01_03920 [Candidatus Kerfeldbacteria bacterium]|nr:hypothetical protein [Candidatus Kerfeldbacteria bacterium]